VPFAVFYLLCKFLYEGVRGFLRKAREVKPAPLCADCIHAHVQYCANAQRALSCTYGGRVRPIKLDVLYCTDYLARNVPAPPRVVGFVREIVPAE